MPTPSSCLSLFKNRFLNALQPLQAWASQPHVEQDLERIFGTSINWASAYKHLAAFRQGDFSKLPPISCLPPNEMPGLWGGYSRDLQRIFLSTDCHPERLSAVLIEEIGHFLDQELCDEETPGDEGAHFTALVLGFTPTASELTLWREEEFTGQVHFQNSPILVEAAAKTRTTTTAKTRPSSTVTSTSAKIRSDSSINTGSVTTSDIVYATKDSVRLVQTTKINQRLVGSKGNDTFVVKDQSVRLEDNLGGKDTVETSVSFDISKFNFIENLTAALGTSPVTLGGNSKANKITGNSGDNVLDGGRGSAIDTLIGGEGDDSYVLSDTLDQIVESKGQGSDTILTTLKKASLTDFGIANVENLTFTGTGSATLAGNDLANVLTGGTDADTLFGSASDSLIGWQGDDFYSVVSQSTRALELDGPLEGNDTISVSILSTYSMAAATNVEVLEYKGKDNSSLTGNSGSNTIYGGLLVRNTIDGGAGDDYLFGGDTTDILFGGAGSDTLVVTQWTDTVLVGSLGTTLRSGKGSDTLNGGEGDDWYVVNSQTAYNYQDTKGSNTIASTVDFSLKYNPNIAANIQNLYLIGKSPLRGTGSDLKNLITGNDGDNRLDAGAGNDTVVAGLGADRIDGQAGNDSLVGGGQPQTDLPANAATPIDLGLRQSYQGKIESRQDTDWIRVSLQAGLTYYFRIIPDFSKSPKELRENSDVAFGVRSLNYNDGANEENIFGLVGDSVFTTSDHFQLVLNSDGSTAFGINNRKNWRHPEDFGQSTGKDFEAINIRAFSFTPFDSGDFYLPVTGAGPALGKYHVFFSDDKSLISTAKKDEDLLASNAFPEVLADNASDTLIGGLGADTLVAMAGRDAKGNFLGDILMGGTNGIPGSVDLDSSRDTLIGGQGADLLDGGNGIDSMVGGAGNDTYFINVAADIVDEEDDGGTDDLGVFTITTADRNFATDLATGRFALNTALLNSLTGEGFDIDLQNNFGNVEHASLVGSANLYALGNGDPNSLVGNFGNNLLVGVAGNDSLLGEGGNDYLIGGDGGDLLDGGSGQNTMDGGLGDDTYIVNDREDRVINEIPGLDGGADLVRTYFNFDPIQGSNKLQQFQPNQPDNSPSRQKASSFASRDITSFYNLENFEMLGEAVYGVGNALGNSLLAGESSALLLGMGGEDSLIGNEGNDSLYGDTPDFYASPDLYAPAPTDTRTQQFLDSVIGDFGSDYIDGGAGDDYLDGGKGFDTMIGGEGDDTFVQDNVDDYIVAGAGANELISSVNIAQAPDGISKLMLVVKDQSPDSGQPEVAESGSFLGTANGNNLTTTVTFTTKSFTLENSNLMELMYAPNEADRFVIGGVTDITDAPGNPDVHALNVSPYYDDLDFPGQKMVELSWVAGTYAETGVVGYTVRFRQLTKSDGKAFVDNDGNPDIWHTYVNGTSQDFQGDPSTPSLTIRNLADGTYDFEVVAHELAIPALLSRESDSARHVTLQGGAGNDAINGMRLFRTLQGGLVDDFWTNPLLQNNPNAPLPLGFIFNPAPYDVAVSRPDRFATYLDGGYGDDFLNGDYVYDGRGDDYTFQNVVFKGLNTMLGGQGSDTFVVKNGGNAIGDEFDWVVKYGNETPVVTEAGNVGSSLNGGQHNVVYSLVNYLTLSDTLVHQGKFIDQLIVAYGFGMGNGLENYISGSGTLAGNTGRDSISGVGLLIGGTAYGTDDVGFAVRDFAGFIYGGNGLVESPFRDTDPVPTDPNGPGAADPSQFWVVPGNYGPVFDSNRNQDTLIAGSSSTLDGGAGRDSLVGSGGIGDMFYVSQGEGGLGSHDIASQDAVFGNEGNDTVMFTDSDYLWWTGHLQGALLDKNEYSIERGSDSDISNLILQAGSPSARIAIGNNDSKGNPNEGSNMIVGNEFDNSLNGGGVGGDKEIRTGVDVLTGGSGSDNFVVQGYTSSTTNAWSPEIIDYETGPLAGFSVWIGIESVYTDADYVVIEDFEAGDNLNLSASTSNYWIGAAPVGNGIPPVFNNNVPLLGYLQAPNTTRFGIYTAGGPNLVAIVNLVGGLELDTLSLELAYDPAPSNKVATDSLFRAHLGWGTFWELEGSSFSKYVNQAYTMEDSYASLETLVRSGDDTFTGGVLADNYNGYGANDSLLGGGGNDTLLGESGNDILFGESGNDSLLGGKGADYIDGGAGDDQMIGSTGDDTYILDSLADVVTESDASTITGGVDWVGSSVSGYALTSNVENLTLLSTATSGTGNNLANRLTGNSSNNILTGLAGNDTLIGQDGVDVLNGGDDNDYYIVDTATDTIQDSGGVADTIQSSAAFDLSNALVAGGTAIEHLVYTGSGNVSLTGNAAQNSMTGAAGSDTLDGQAGIDTLIGGAGDDYYVLTTINTDAIVENEGSGTDTVLIDGTFSLSSWPDIENIELTAAVASVLTGNSQDNLIVGNILNDDIRGDAGDDTLTGTSAVGSGEIDTLTGGTGADLFVLGNSANVFYNNLPLKGDYAYIKDFSVEQGDQLQLSGGATYVFYAGTGTQSLLYRDADGNQAWSAADNLIAEIIATGGGGENKNLVDSDLAKIAIYA